LTCAKSTLPIRQRKPFEDCEPKKRVRCQTVLVREDLHEIFLWQRASYDRLVKDDRRSNFAAHGAPSLCHNRSSLDRRARNRQGSFKVALIKPKGSRFLIGRLLRGGLRTHERCAWSDTDTRREGGACMHPLLINTENDHRRRTLEPSATDRKLTALERQRAKLVAILAIHRMSRIRRARLRARLATVDEIIGLVRRTVH
jgi:hypothetical protein